MVKRGAAAGLQQSNYERIPLEEVVRFLALNIGHIHSVNQGAKEAGYSQSYFSRQVKEIYGIQPLVIYNRIKLIEILLFLLDCPNGKSAALAEKTNFRSGRMLGEFLARHANVSIPELRLFKGHKIRHIPYAGAGYL